MLTNEQRQQAESESLANDLALYEDAQRRMAEHQPFSPEYMAAWRALEAVKNRHRGYKPGEEPADKA